MLNLSKVPSELRLLFDFCMWHFEMAILSFQHYRTLLNQALRIQPFIAYAGAKALLEKTVWEFEDVYKDLNVMTFCLNYCYGPFAPGFSMAS